MDGVAAEVAEEVLVLFEYSNGDALASEKKTEHDAGGTTADDAAGGGERIGWGGHVADEPSKGAEGRQKR